MIRQRILYVGIGGSGLDLGIQIDGALKREICGLDGNNLSRKGLAYGTNELPPFVQQVYIDLAAAAVSGVSRQLEGSNVRTVTNIIPTINAYADVAKSLRLHNLDQVRDWLPPAGPDEPIVNPLSAGAGQYPTVGRAALFQSIHQQGMGHAIAGTLENAIADLSGSLGDLQTYTGGNFNTSVAVYVGFSASGGTGCGLFYDVLMILIDELKKNMVATDVVIIPALLLPSTFKGVLDPIAQKRAELNASTAVVDLASMIEQMSTSDAGTIGDSLVAYPGVGAPLSLGGLSSKVQMPVAAVISSTAGMKREDTVRMLASAIVSQISLSGGQDNTGGQPTNNMTFGEQVVNILSNITMVGNSIMHRPLMPMVSASLTVPSRKIADIVARNLLVKSMIQDEGYVEPSPEEMSKLGDRILSLSGLKALVEADVFTGEYQVSFGPSGDIKNESDLRDKIAKLNQRVDTQALPVIRDLVKSSLQNMTTFDILEGMEKVLGSEKDVPMRVLATAAQQALSRIEVGDDSLGTGNAQAAANRKVSQKKNKLAFLPGRKKLTQQQVKAEFDRAKREFEAEVRKIWMSEWAARKMQWKSSVQNGRNRIEDLNSWWENLITDSQSKAQASIANVVKSTDGIKDFIPKRGVDERQAVDNIYKQTRDALLSERQIANPSTFNLVQAILGESSGEQAALRKALGVFRRNLGQQEFNDAVLEKLRSEVLHTFGNTSPGQQAAFSSLATLLDEMVSPNPDSDAIDLATAIGGLVPGVLVPNGDFVQASVVITYPGQKNEKIEQRIADLVFSDGALRQLIGAGPAMTGAEISRLSSVTIQALGDSDSITVNINKIGQGLFDNPEVAGVLSTWQKELANPGTEKLQWRQRLGYDDLDRVLGSVSRTKILHHLLLGLWGGLIEIEEGTVDSPAVLVIHDMNRALSNSALPKIRLATGATLGGWTSLLSAFEKLLIEIGMTDSGFKQDVLDQLITYTPDDLTGPSVGSVPIVIQTILDQRRTKLNEASAALGNPQKFSDLALSEFRSAQSFWSSEFRQAWSLDGKKLFNRSLQQIQQLD